MLDKTIFREYDIRGIFDKQLNYETGYLIGQSYGSKALELGEKEVVIGYDNRLTSEKLHDEVIKGLISTGIDVTDIGLVTTPMLYFARINYNLPLGIMVTASHNPKEYNGFKFSFSKEGNAYGKQIEEFFQFTNNRIFKQGTGLIELKNIKEDYIQNIINSLNFGTKKIKAVFDCGNGTASVILKDIISKIDNIEPYYLYCNSDGNFPNHHPDPAVSDNLKDLQKKVVELSYDIGIAFDGDADRVGIVDENGNIVKTDILMAIIYNYLNKNLINRNALFDVKCSRTLTDELKKLNINETMYRTGASYTNMMMQTGKFDFGGEYSGHLFFKDKYQGFDDGIYAGLRIVEILSNNNTLSELYQNFNKYFSTEELFINVNENEKETKINFIKKYAISKNYKINDIDGVRIEFADGWALIRASNTTPRLSLRFEAITKDRLLDIQNEFLKVLEEVKWRNFLTNLKHSYHVEMY